MNKIAGKKGGKYKYRLMAEGISVRTKFHGGYGMQTIKTIMKRVIAMMLCAALVLCAAGTTQVLAVDHTLPHVAVQTADSDHLIYAKGNETTFVPEGYTYVYDSGDGTSYTTTAESDMYITGRVLTADEAAALANLEYGREGYVTSEDGSLLVCKEFDAKDAVAYSAAVQEILGNVQVQNGEKVGLLSEVYTSSSMVKVMITFEEKAVGQMDTMQVSLGETLGTKELNAMKAVERQQQIMTRAIHSALGYDIQVSENFTLLTNSVSATIRYGDLATVREMDGVKNVFLMPYYTVPDIHPSTVDAGSMQPNMKYAGPAMGSEETWELGYQGEGMSVAIIDTGLCYENPSFSIESQNQKLLAFTQEDIQEILKDNTLHAELMSEDLTAADLYYSSKVPFGYNYGDGEADYGTDDETLMGHGTHVAGIVAGNLPDEAQEDFQMKNLGIAPEAQLVIMKVFDRNGNCYFDSLISAMEDAIILGVDCANLSLGSACGPAYYEGYTEVYDAASKAGINIVVAAGNDAFTGYQSLWGNEMVESSSVSTGTVGMPGTFDAVLTVASAENGTVAQVANNEITWMPSPLAGKMSDFSSWGPTDSLTMKPDITGIGGNVFSSYFGTYYVVASGTSMASPAVAASAALVRQYLKNTNVVEEAELTSVVNRLLMSTATPLFDEEHDTFYFVRRQGAGLANAANAITSQAYIQVEGTDKAKLELGDDPARTGKYEMTFEIVNFSDAEKTYSLSTTTLGQKAEGGLIKNGEVTYLVYNYARELNPEVIYSVHDGQVHVPANSKASVTVTISLSDADRAYIEERFPYGSYVEGFIQLSSKDSVNLSVPFLAFYGDFGEGPILEEGTYETLMGGLSGYTTADQFHNSIWSYIPEDPVEGVGSFGQRQFYLGDSQSGEMKMPVDQVSGSILPFYSANAGISPNGDGVLDYLEMGLGLKRNASAIHYTVTNRDTGEVIWSQTTDESPKTYFSDNYHAVVYCGALEETSLSLEWLYPTMEIDWDEDGIADYTTWDTSKCLLDENTWITIQAEVIPEYQSSTPNANNTVEFTLYIDSTGPIGSSSSFLFADRDLIYDLFGSTVFDGQFHIMVAPDEYWFMDYSYTIPLTYDEDAGTWSGYMLSEIYVNQEPSRGKSPRSNFNFATFDENCKLVYFAGDYAGNVSAYELTGGEALLDLVELQPDATSIYVGEAIQIKNVAENAMGTKISWRTSDETIAQIVESGGSVCTIEGLAPGEVEISGGFNDYRKAIKIQVVDPDAEGVERLIDAIGAVDKDSGDAIQAARKAYDALTEAQKALVGNYDKLLAAEEAYEIVLNCLAGNHVFGEPEVLREPDCTQDGQTCLTCKYCGYQEIQTIPAHCASSIFTDVNTGKWYHEYIDYVVDHKLMNGMGGGKFAPDGTTTRAMLVTTLYRMAGEPEVMELSTFTDVPANQWYAKAVAWAQDLGIATGATSTTFLPGAPATREQAAAFLYRYVTLYLKAEPVKGADLTVYKDADKISNYAKEAVAWATAEGLFQGFENGTMQPKGTLTRAQMAKLLTILDQKF